MKKGSWAKMKLISLGKRQANIANNRIVDGHELVKLVYDENFSILALDFSNSEFFCFDISWFIKLALIKISSVCTLS